MLRLFLLNINIRQKQNWKFYLFKGENKEFKITALTKISKCQKQTNKQKIYLSGAHKTINSYLDKKIIISKEFEAFKC